MKVWENFKLVRDGAQSQMFVATFVNICVPHNRYIFLNNHVHCFCKNYQLHKTFYYVLETLQTEFN